MTDFLLCLTTSLMLAQNEPAPQPAAADTPAPAQAPVEGASGTANERSTEPESYDAGEIQALATITPEGLVRIDTFAFEPVAQGQGQGQGYDVYRQSSLFELTAVQAMQADGTPVDAATLPQRLATEQRVLLGAASVSPESSLRRLYRPDMLILMPTGDAQLERQAVDPAGGNAPSQPAPQGGVATLADGTISLTRTRLVAQPETRTVTEIIDKDGLQQEVEKSIQVTVWVTDQQTFEVPASSVAAIDPQGGGIDRATLEQRLAQATPVLFAVEPQQGPVIDPWYAQSLAPDAIILVSPRQSSEAAGQPSVTQSAPAETQEAMPPAPPMESKPRPQRPRDAALDAVIAETHRSLAETHYNRLQFEGAVEDLQTAVEHKPDDPLLHYLLAYMQRRAGETQAAGDTLEKAKRLEQSAGIEDWYRRMEPYQGPARAWLEKERAR